MKTFSAKPADIERKWYVIDAENKILKSQMLHVDPLGGKPAQAKEEVPVQPVRSESMGLQNAESTEEIGYDYHNDNSKQQAFEQQTYAELDQFATDYD